VGTPLVQRCSGRTLCSEEVDLISVCRRVAAGDLWCCQLLRCVDRGALNLQISSTKPALFLPAEALYQKASTDAALSLNPQ